MRKFSDELVQDRDFEIGGEMFRWRYPYWEEFADQLDADIAATQAAVKAATTETNGDDPVDDTVRAGYETLIERITMFIDPENDGPKRWKQLSKRKTNPVPHYMYRQLYEWLLEVSSGRPTEQPSPSESGPGSTDSTSPESSS